MATSVLVLGFSGTGKSTSLRNFKSDEIAIVSVNGKRLPFRNNFKEVLNSDDYSKILTFMKNTKAKTIIVDDSQYLMANEFMRRTKETGFQKYTEIGKNFWGLIKSAEKLPDDVTVYFLHHPETGDDGMQKAKTIGKLLDDKITVEGMFTIVLKTTVVDKEYLFSTQTDGTDPCKTPIGMFSSSYIPNDLKLVDDTIREYYGMTEESTADIEVEDTEPVSEPVQESSEDEDIFANVDEETDSEDRESLAVKASEMYQALDREKDKTIRTKVSKFVKENGKLQELTVEQLKEVIGFMS